jgi:hypothetical protein
MRHLLEEAAERLFEMLEEEILTERNQENKKKKDSLKLQRVGLPDPYDDSVHHDGEEIRTMNDPLGKRAKDARRSAIKKSLKDPKMNSKDIDDETRKNVQNAIKNKKP